SLRTRSHGTTDTQSLSSHQPPNTTTSHLPPATASKASPAPHHPPPSLDPPTWALIVLPGPSHIAPPCTRLDRRLPRGSAAAEEAEASVRQPQPAGDQVEPQRLELPTHRPHARRPLAEFPVEAQHREEQVLEAVASESLQQHRAARVPAGSRQSRLAGIFQHAFRLRVADLRRKLRARSAAAQRQRLVALVRENAERVAYVRFVEPVFVLMPSMPTAALIDGMPGVHQQAAVHSTVTLLARLRG